MTHKLKYSRVFIPSLLALMTLISAIAFVSAAHLRATVARVGVNQPAIEKLHLNLLEPATALAPAPLSGTKTVCPSGCDYPTLTAAIADIQSQGLGGPIVLELASTYVSSGETFPLTFTNLTGASATNTVTVRPASGATNLAITSANTTATIDLNNANFLTIDGRAASVGVNKDLTIENTASAGVALNFINEASNNAVKYAALKGVSTNTLRGVVLFSTTTGANGNDNNTIDNCDIRDGATTPAIAVYSSGSSTTTAQNNSGNTISNCNIFNFYLSDNFAAGVRLAGGNTDWTIAGNSFYQTSTRAASSGSIFGLLFETPSGNNFSVTNNFFGGSAPGANGAAWTTTGTTAANRFVGIHLNAGTTTPSSVQGNTIKNFVWTSASNFAVPPGAWTGINIEAGSVNVGTVAGNTIGSGTGTGSVSVTTSATGGATFGIAAGGAGSRVISNNTIGSITTNGTATAISASLVGIQVTAGTNTISNNTIGSATTANSLNAATSSTSNVAQQVTGILSSSSGGAIITGNTIANLNNNYDSTANAGQIRGIVTSSGANTITSNTVRNLSTSSRNQNSTTHSVFGITQTSTTAGQTISQNVVHSLSNSAAVAAVLVTGISYTGNASSGANIIARNLIHSLAVSSTSSSSGLRGIQFPNGTFTAQNNMVRLGIDSNGISTAGASRVFGILDIGFAENRNFYHNSVYIGGTHTSGTAGSVPFITINSNNARTIKNNIFVNVRSNNGGTGPQYAVVYGDVTSTPPGGITSDNNIFYSSGAGTVLGLYNGIDQTTIQAWRNASGQDAASAFIDPFFINPAGGTPDLHLQARNPAEAAGVLVPSVTDDFDGETRSGLTPTDIGADAGNFTFGVAPLISYGLLSNGSTANRTLTGFATITDDVSVAGGANLPRFYFKKSTDADVFGGNTATDNGWKFVTASNSSSPYSFTINYSIINGGSVAAGDTIQYFVVAQDDANNLGSNPIGAKAAGDPPIQHVNARPTTVNSYNIVANTISGTRTICASGCDYSSLTGANGVFAAINNSLVTGNLVVNITGDLTEDGTNGLNEMASNDVPSPAFTVTIQPANGTPKVISGNVPNGMIRLNGADRVTIDGRFNNTGRFLTFRNTNSSNPTITLRNDASNNTIRSCIIEGATISDFFNGVVFFSEGLTTGNDSNIVSDNQIRDRSDAPGVPSNLISSQGSSAAVTNSGNTISNNELFNFESRGILISPTNSGNESWTISGNTIYQTAPRTTMLFGINLTSSGTNLISQNTIHDLNSTGSLLRGINVTPDGFSTVVSQNRIYALQSSTNESEVIAIAAFLGFGATTVINNQITLVPSGTNDQIIIGIADQGFGTFNSYFNSVLLGGAASGASSTWACLRTTDSISVHTSRNNICFNNRTGGSGSHFAAGNQGQSTGSFSSDYNLFVGTGATTANFMDSGITSTGTPVSFASWKTSTGGDAHSQAGNPGGDFTTSMFADPTEGDLHIVPAGNPLVSNIGIPVSGIATDYDNEPRSATTPDIGSDEFNISNPATSAPTVIFINDGDPDNGVTVNTTMTYTIRFSEDIDAATVSAVDFDNAGSASITIGTIVETSPGVFSVQVTPTSEGTIILRIPTGAVISDPAGQNLITPVVDNDTVTVFTSITLTVNTLGDAADTAPDGNCDTDTGTPGSQCTLRAAIHEANNRPSDDTIDFSLPPNSTITLNNSLDVITNNLAINGPGNLLTIQRSTSVGTPNFRIFTINPATTVTISSLTITNGHAPDGTLSNSGADGGGILNAGNLSLTNVRVVSNTSGAATGANGGNGGGIYNSGALTLRNVTLNNNQTGSGFFGGSGGGLFNLNGPVSIMNTTIEGNAVINAPGGGVFNSGGMLNVIDSSVSTNQSFSGGGVFNETGTLTITNCTISSNTAKSGGQGGGVLNNHGSLTLTNCTVTNNETVSGGSGIQNLGTTNIKNTIVANNRTMPGFGGSDVTGTFVTQGHNLIGNNNGSTGFTPGTNANGDLVGTAATPIDPLLGPLQNNGGATQTHALLTGSPALDNGDNSFVTNPPFNGPPFNDQRGPSFNRSVDGNADGTTTVDIGAFEAQVAVQDITDKTTNEDTQLQFLFNVGGTASITSVTATSSNTALVPNNAANIALTGSGSTRILAITPVANQFGISTITVTVSGSNSQSTSDTFLLTVNPVADTPSATSAATNANTQTTSGLVISRNPADGPEVTHFKITGITGGSLFKNNGTTAITNGNFITFAEGNAGLKFTPGTSNGSFMVQASTSASDAGLGGGTATAIITVNPLGGVLRFSAGNYSVTEGAGSTTITVERSGDTSRAATVDYASSDHSNPADFIPCNSPGAGFASSRCDFTTAIGTLRFAAGETAKTFNVLISQDNYMEGPETLELTLSNPTGGAVFGVPQTAILTIIDDATEPATNPIDTSSEFVRSQYHDFLNREPDAPGLAFWVDNIEKCNDAFRRPPGQTVAQCIDKQRESTAVAFFMSPEFQITGGFVYHLYKGSLTGSPNYDGGSPGRFPTSLEFMRDLATVSEGIVVNNAISGAVVEANRNRLAAEFVLRPEFVAKYGGLNDTLYVQELFNTTGIAATAAEKQALVDGLTGGTETRASVLRKVVDGTVVISESNVQFTTPYGQAFTNQENQRVFVFMEYVGYLRRNPDQAGYVFWLGKLNFYGGDPFQAEMVRSFILSPEYRQRFGQ